MICDFTKLIFFINLFRPEAGLVYIKTDISYDVTLFKLTFFISRLKTFLKLLFDFDLERVNFK